MNAKQNSQPAICGYLNKYRPFVSGLFSSQWEARFFSLTGTALQYYRSEAETAQHPRGHVEVKVGPPPGAGMALVRVCVARSRLLRRA